MGQLQLPRHQPDRANFRALWDPGLLTTFIRHARWCGTAGWLPGYPYAIEFVGYLGIHSLTAGLLIPALSLAGALAVIWWGWTRSLPPWSSFLILVLFAVFPGAIYNYAEYPTALALLGMVTAIFAATRQRNAVVALGIAVAGISYTSAGFAALGLVVAMVVDGWPRSRNEVLKRAAWGAVGFSSLALLAVHDQIAFHHWDAYGLIQNETHETFGSLPGSQLYDLIVHRTTGTQILIGHNGAIIMAIQAVLAIAVVLAASSIGLRHWWRSERAERSERSTLDLYPAVVGFVSILIMADSGTGSIWHRGLVLAAPSIVGFRRLPIWIRVQLPWSDLSPGLSGPLSH